MLKILSIEETRRVEAESDATGHTYDMMMQAAGKAVAEYILDLIEDRPAAKITVLVGGGNNGGDGLVAGLVLAQENPELQVRFYLLKERDEDDKNMKAVQDAGLFTAYAGDDADKRVLRNMIADSDVVIDALFGIGVRLPIRDEPAQILRTVNQALKERAGARRSKTLIDPEIGGQIERASKSYVIAVDCPSGLDCDTGEIDANVIPADATITFIAAKRGQFEFPGAGTVGELIVAPIDVPDRIETLIQNKHHLLDNETARNHLPERPKDGHKGTYGKTLVIAGSINYIGAAGLASHAAYRSGTGLVSVATPAPVASALAAQSLEVTWILLPHDMGVIASSAAKVIHENVEKYDALLIGCGIGQEDTTGEMIQELFSGQGPNKKRSIGFGEHDSTDWQDDQPDLPPLVIDADGLNLLARVEAWWQMLPPNTIITPHPGEMARLAGVDLTEIKQSHRLTLAVEKAKAWNLILVLKGAHTIVADPDGRTYTSPFKTDALSTAGTGDILAGLITGFVAQGLEPFEAAALGVYVHGKAGLVAEEQQLSGRGIIAGDVLSMIPLALATIELG